MKKLLIVIKNSRGQTRGGQTVIRAIGQTADRQTVIPYDTRFISNIALIYNFLIPYFSLAVPTPLPAL